MLNKDIKPSSTYRHDRTHTAPGGRVIGLSFPNFSAILMPNTKQGIQVFPGSGVVPLAVIICY
ncbi:MAG: hypothetical protein ACYS80_25510, partial [Planctomycetota bacterium]